MGLPTVMGSCYICSWRTPLKQLFYDTFVSQGNSQNVSISSLPCARVQAEDLGPANQMYPCETDLEVGDVKDQAHEGHTALWKLGSGGTQSFGDSRAVSGIRAWARAWDHSARCSGGITGAAPWSVWAFLLAVCLSQRLREPPQLTEHLVCSSPGCNVWLGFRSQGRAPWPTVTPALVQEALSGHQGSPLGLICPLAQTLAVF